MHVEALDFSSNDLVTDPPVAGYVKKPYLCKYSQNSV